MEHVHSTLILEPVNGPSWSNIAYNPMAGTEIKGEILPHVHHTVCDASEYDGLSNMLFSHTQTYDCKHSV